MLFWHSWKQQGSVSSMMVSEGLPETEWRVLADDFHIGISKAAIKAVSVEGLLINACFITVMKVIYQT